MILYALVLKTNPFDRSGTGTVMNSLESYPGLNAPSGARTHDLRISPPHLSGKQYKR